MYVNFIWVTRLVKEMKGRIRNKICMQSIITYNDCQITRVCLLLSLLLLLYFDAGKYETKKSRKIFLFIVILDWEHYKPFFEIKSINLNLLMFSDLYLIHCSYS